MLDIEKNDQLIDYLVRSGHIKSNENIDIRILAGGVSNRTVMVTRDNGEAWVLKQALHKLKVQVDWFSDPNRSQREALGIEWLNRLIPNGNIPKLIFLDPLHHLLAMEAIPNGHVNWKDSLLKGEINLSLIYQFADLLALIHSESAREEKIIRPIFQDRSYFETLRLDPYYLYAGEQVPLAKDFMVQLVEITRNRALTLVHGDYSPKNVLVYQKKLILLDHEVIHFGDPCFDIGFSMTHFLSKAHHLPKHKQRFREAAHSYWSRYAEKTINQPWAKDIEKYAVFHTLGCLLARVAGRSPLEYLKPEIRQIQQNVVVDLIRDSNCRIDILIDSFIDMISK
jgi:5-methylthioribose kinase